MNKVQIACCFRHDHSVDGLLIPASEEIQDGPRKGYCQQVGGFLCYLPEGSDEVLWSFVKYEAPEVWEPGWKRQSTKGQMATTRLGSVHCESCGHSGYMAIRGDASKNRCPECGKGGVDIEPIKETSDEFMRLVGDLRDPLEQACRAAASTGLDFEFPQVLVTARGIEVSPDVPAGYAGKISAAGFGVRDIKAMDGFSAMLALHNSSPALSIVPDIASGVVDEDAAKRGICQNWPVFTTWLKLYLPERRRPRGRIPFQSMRF